MTYGKSLTGFDVDSLKKAVSPAQESQIPSVDPNQPVIDINAPADTNVKKEETTAEEKKA